MINLKENLPQVGSKVYRYDIVNNRIKLYDDVNNKKIDFIVNIDNELLFGFGHFRLNKKEEKLIMAGEVIISDGKITYMNNNSGHYQPSVIEFENFLKLFKEKYLNIMSDDIKITTYNWGVDRFI